MTGGYPVAFWSQSISDVNAIAFTTSIEEREVLFLYFDPDTTREKWIKKMKLSHSKNRFKAGNCVTKTFRECFIKYVRLGIAKINAISISKLSV
jgi:hypothetical protein